jgi:hypothetical protein
LIYIKNYDIIIIENKKGILRYPPMNIEDRIMAGASDEEIDAMLNAVKAAAKAKREEEVKAQAQARAEKEKAKKREHLKAEARAHVINAMIAYSEAFDLLDEGEEWDDEMVAKAEELVKEYEQMIPVYMALAKAININPSDCKLVIDEEDLEKFFK